MTTVSQIDPVWASDSQSVTEKPDKEVSHNGFVENSKPSYEHINYIWKDIQVKFNDVIATYSNLDGPLLRQSPLIFIDDAYLGLGDVADAKIMYSSSDSGQFRIGVPTTNKILSFISQADVDDDLGVWTTAQPTMRMYDQTTASFLEMISYTTYSSFSTSVDRLQFNPGGTGIVKIGTGNDSHSLAFGSLFVTGDLEIDQALFIEEKLEAVGTFISENSFNQDSVYSSSSSSYVIGNGDDTSVIMFEFTSDIITVTLPLGGENGRIITLKKRYNASNTVDVEDSDENVVDSFSGPYAARQYIYVIGIDAWVILDEYDI